MLCRKMFRIENKGGHVLALCWACSEEEAKTNFCVQIAPPYEVITEDWKTDAYFKVLDHENLHVKEYQKYWKSNKKDNGSEIFVFGNEVFNDDNIYEKLEFKPDETSLVKIIKIYKRDEKCPKEGKWRKLNAKNGNDELFIEEGDKFPVSHNEREYFYYIASLA